MDRRHFLVGAAGAAVAGPAVAHESEIGPVERAYFERLRRLDLVDTGKIFADRDMTEADHEWLDAPLVSDELDRLPTSDREWAALLLLMKEEFAPDERWDVSLLLNRARAAIGLPPKDWSR